MTKCKKLKCLLSAIKSLYLFFSFKDTNIKLINNMSRYIFIDIWVVYVMICVTYTVQYILYLIPDLSVNMVV